MDVVGNGDTSSARVVIKDMVKDTLKDNKRHGSGLLPLPKDDRDFKLGAIISLPNIKDIPDTFDLGILPVKDQQESDFCTAYATCLASEFQEKTSLYAPYSFALSKELSGDPEVWGQDLRTACKAHEKYGAITESEAPIMQSIDELRFSGNYPPYLKEKARIHKKQSYVSVTGQYESFDDIRASMWRYREQRKAVVFGVIWNWNLTDYILGEKEGSGFGHAICAVGWEKDYLIIQNSYGVGAGKLGRHKLHQTAVNDFVENYGAYMFTDFPPEHGVVAMENSRFARGRFWKKIGMFLQRI